MKRIVLGPATTKLIETRKKLAEVISMICNAECDEISTAEIIVPLIDLECLLDDFSGTFEEETR